MKRSDTDIRHNVEAELQWDRNIDARKTGVIVTDGVVMPTGEVTHLTVRRAAEDIAIPGRSSPMPLQLLGWSSGVGRIENRLEVR
jgi:hypothetical protein